MRLLLLFTSYRQFKELDYQRKFLERCDYISNNFDILFHCNNLNIDKKIIQNKIKELPCKKYKLVYGENKGGYLRGQFQAISEMFTLGFLNSYDFVIHLHPDIFIVNEKPIIELVNIHKTNNYDLFVSRIFGKSHPSYATDFFAFKPSNIFAELFSAYAKYPQDFQIPLETIFYQLIQEFNISYLEIERFKVGRYFRDIDSLGLWHEHRLAKIDLYFRMPQLRYLYTIFDLVKNPKISSCIVRDFVVRKIQKEKQDNLLSLLSR